MEETELAMLKAAIKKLRDEWGVRPRVTLACQGYADEHWQFWNPRIPRQEDEVSEYVLTRSGGLEKNR